MNRYAIHEGETIAALTIHLSARKYHEHTIEEMFERIAQHQPRSSPVQSTSAATNRARTAALSRGKGAGPTAPATSKVES